MNTEMNKCRRELVAMLVCSFGYFEAEDEIVERCLVAISKKDMAPLERGLSVFCAGDETILKVSAEKVKETLERCGVWQ